MDWRTIPKLAPREVVPLTRLYLESQPRAGLFSSEPRDRLARSVSDLVKIKEKLEAKKVGLRVLGINLDTSTPTGKLMLNLLGSIAEFERELMLERQREGIAKAKAEGKYRGRQPTARRKSEDVLRLRAEGKSANDIKDALNISRASVFRILAATAEQGT